MAAESTKYILAIDLGTGGPKVALVSTDGEIVGHEFEKTELLLLPGGGANSSLWCQIHADILDRSIRQVKEPGLANVRGAAFLASVALGYITFDDIPERVETTNTYDPNPDNRKTYDELFGEFLNIYTNNRRTYARLNATV